MPSCDFFKAHESSDGASAKVDGVAKKATEILGLGKFVGLDWKVGVGVQSSNCSDLCTPFVALTVHFDRRWNRNPLDGVVH